MFGMYVKASNQNGEDPPGMRMESSSNSRNQRDHRAEKEATCLAPALVFKGLAPHSPATVVHDLNFQILKHFSVDLFIGNSLGASRPSSFAASLVSHSENSDSRLSSYKSPQLSKLLAAIAGLSSL